MPDERRSRRVVRGLSRRIGAFVQDALGELLAELHAPLVEGIDPHQPAQGGRLVLVERQERAEACRVERFEQDRGAGPVALVAPMRIDGVRGTTDDTDLSTPGPDGVFRTLDDFDGKADGQFGTGNTFQYNIIGYAGVVITKVDFSGNTNEIWVQPAFLVSNKVTAAQNDTEAVVEGVYLPPKLVIP